MLAVLFHLGTERYALPLRCVQEVIAIGPLTPVLTAPPAIIGAVNVKGHVVPVVDLDALRAARARPHAIPQIGMLLQIDDCQLILAATRVMEVTDLTPSPEDLPPVTAESFWSPYLSTQGKVPLLDPQRLVQRLIEEINRAAGHFLAHFINRGTSPDADHLDPTEHANRAGQETPAHPHDEATVGNPSTEDREE